jgi:serine protease Do
MLNDPFLGRFFGDQPRFGLPEERAQRGLGSGVIISPDGVILTNNHVVAQADKIRVKLPDDREVDAQVVGTDPKSDVAVLRVEEKNLPFIAVADSSKNRVGDIVLAIGSPFALSHSVTMGIISALNRNTTGITEYGDFIQTDAAINPGNSGGALINMRGELIGINTAIVSGSGGNQGIGFAIPSNMAMAVKDAILKDGHVVRGWLGVMIQPVTPEIADNLGAKDRKGVLVSDVTKDGPAHKAGLKRGDIILKIDDTETTDPAQLKNLIAAKGKATRVKVGLLRDNKPVELMVTLGELPDEARAGKNEPSQLKEDLGLFSGVTVKKLDPQIRERLRIPEEVKGVLVADVEAGSAAAEFGLQPGDIVMEVNRKATPDIPAFKQAVQKEAKRLLLLIYRDGNTLFLAISK